MKTFWPKISVTVALTALVCLAATVAEAAEVTLSNSGLSLSFDQANHYAVNHLVQRAKGFDFAGPLPQDASIDRSPWHLVIRGAGGALSVLTAADAKSATPQSALGKLTVTWTGVGNKACPANLTVVMTVTMTEGTGQSLWRLAVQGEAPGVLWQVDFPRLMALRPVGEDELAIPQYWGRITREFTKVRTKVNIGYPSPMSMQFMAAWGTPDKREPALKQVAGTATESGWAPDRSDATGLYWAAEDGNCYYKRFVIDTAQVPGRYSLWLQHYPAYKQWPPKAGTQQVNYQMPYQVAITAFTGDYHEACNLYRAWAQQQFWCSRGPADRWPVTVPPAGSEQLTQWVPEWFRNIGFWAKFYQEPAKVVPEWAAYAAWLRVPMASHYYRSPIAKFDNNYPEMFPTDPYFLEGIRDARAMNVRPLPYTNGVIWDMDTQSWINQHGITAAIKDEAGHIHIWPIGTNRFAYMCPATKLWHQRIAETANEEIVEHGCSGVYLDCLTATASYPCYDPTHGHTLHGGDYYAQGQHRMMHDLRAQIRAVDPTAAFFPEECGEWVIDEMDGFLTLDLTRSGPYPNQQVFPLFTQVYHDYTINCGSDATLDYPPDRFAWEMGRLLTWGSQPLNSPAIAPIPKPGDPNSEMLREIVQAYYVAGLPFLQGGRAEPLTIHPLGTPAGQRGLDLAAAPYSLTYQDGPNRKRTWTGPAVLASAWSRDGDLGIVMVNVTNKEQPAELTVKAGTLGLKPGAVLLRTWPRPAQQTGLAAGLHKLTIPARKVAIYVLTTNPQKAALGRKLLDTPWRLLTVKSGAFQPLKAPAETLWACSDGPVVNQRSAAGMTATPMYFDATGKLQPRHGLHPTLPEGQALPREYSQQSFLLLRSLPCRVRTNGQVLVLAGDKHCLSCLASGGASFTFDHPGWLVATAAGSGKSVHALARDTHLTLPPGGPYLVGYGQLVSDDLAGSLAAAGRGVSDRAAALSRMLAAMDKSDQPAADLARASVALADLEQTLDELPGACIAESPLSSVRRQVQALVTAEAGGCLMVTSQHDWLAAGIDKDLQVLAWSPAGVFTASPRLTALGNWPAGAVKINQPRPVGTAKDIRRFAAELLLTDGRYEERMTPVVARAEVRRGGLTYACSAVLRLEANRPMELQGQPDPLTAIAGRQATARLVYRNWSPYDLKVSLTAQGPAGWKVQAPAQPVTVPAGKNVPVEVSVSTPSSAPRGQAQLRCVASYAGDKGSRMTAFIRMNVQPQLVPLVATANKWPRPTPKDLAVFRVAGKMALYARSGQTMQLTIKNIRVTHYTNSVAYRLLDPDLKVMAQGSIPVDKSHVINTKAPQTGGYYLELRPMSGSATVETNLRPVADMATPTDTLHLFCSKITRYFYVPAGAKSFALGAQDGGPDEGARFIVTSPTGRVAYDYEGNFHGGSVSIAVKPGEAGKLWTIHVLPRQDLTFWLEGDVCPYLSTAPDRVLIDRSAQGGEKAF